jgi:hypothetical protein
MDTSAQAIAQLYSDFGSADFQNNWVAQDWNLHDMVGYPTTAGSTAAFKFYTVPNGQNDPNLAVTKTLEQSNLGTPNQIGGDYFFIVQSIRLFILLSAKARQAGTGVSADTFFSARQLAYTRLFEAIKARGTLRWSINNKTVLLENQPFQTFSAGFGLGVVLPPQVGFTTVAGITSGVNAYAANSPLDIDEGAMGDPFSLGQPVVLAPSTTFNVDLESSLGVFPPNQNIAGTSANQAATIWLGCWLTGQKVRARS